jgi:hypothetical protein
LKRRKQTFLPPWFDCFNLPRMTIPSANSVVRSIASACALMLACALPQAARAQDSDTPAQADPNLAWPGAEYPWPAQAMQAPTLVSQLDRDGDNPPRRAWHIAGPNLDISLSGLGPFYDDPTIAAPQEWKNSLVLHNSRCGTALLCFTRLGNGVFFPTLDSDALMGYAKALVKTSAPATGRVVKIVEQPGELPRKQLYFLARPLFLTWSLSDAATGENIVRTDYFFDLGGEAGLLVVSVVCDKASHGNVMAWAQEIFRYSYIVHDEKPPLASGAAAP